MGSKRIERNSVMNSLYQGRGEVGALEDLTFKVCVEAELTMETQGNQSAKRKSRRDRSPGSQGGRLQWSVLLSHVRCH